MPTPAYHTLNDIIPYKTGKPIDELARELDMPIESIVKLASNENPLGCSPKATQAMQAAFFDNAADTARYPDGSGYYLKQAIIDHHASEARLTQEQITLGNGSNDALDLITRTFVNHSDSTVFSQYAFAVYWLASKAVGAKTIIVNAKKYGHDLPAMAKAIQPNTKVVFLANPNNPTGTHFSHDELVQFLQSVPKNVLVVLDEAYVEYFEPNEYLSSLSLLADFANLIITRTFSKSYGLASLRVGYALSSPKIADLLNRVRQPFNVNSFAQAAAIAALKDQDFVAKSRELNNQQMRVLENAFDDLGMDYIPSKANFITLNASKAGGSDNAGNELYEALLKQGIITRPLGGYGMGQWLRVSVGLAEENARFVSVLKSIKL